MIVVESSAVVDALIGTPPNPQLLAQLSDEDLHAPALLDFEVASALRGHVLGHRLGAERLYQAADDFVSLQVERYPMTHLLEEILALRENFTVYDAAYLVLARTLGVPLISADRKLMEASRIGVDVRVFAAP